MSTAIINSTGSFPKAARKNLLINGDFRIWQRGFSGTSGYVADRWRPTTGIATQARVSNTAETCAIRLVASNAGDRFFGQGVELDVVGLPSQFPVGTKLTFSFRAKAPNGANLRVYSAFRDAVSSGSNQSFIENEIIGTGTGSYENYVHTIEVDVAPNATNTSLAVFIGASLGVSDELEVSWAQLEFGDTATDFEYRPIAEELSLCQRYYFKNATWVKHGAPISQTGGFGQRRGSVEFPVSMRVTPTVTYDISATGLETTSITSSSPTGVEIYSQHSGTSNYANYYNLVADAEL